MANALDNDDLKVEVLRLVNDGMSYRQIEERVGVSYSAINKFVTKSSYKSWWVENPKPIASGQLYDHHTNIPHLGKNRYIVTSAQNNTFAHGLFMDSLEVLASEIDALILVGTFSYNLNGFQNIQKGGGEWFDPRVKPYIMDQPAVLANGLMWCGELNILPTAVNPTSGLQSYTKNASGIIPHAKVQLESIPTHKQDPTRMLYTTGAITKRNYIQKKSGQKASFHHVFGALLVEVDDDGDWFVRQLIADSDTGEFYDLNTRYTPNGSYYDPEAIVGINWGDIHVEKLDEQAANASFYNRDSMLNELNPQYQFIHDVLDFEARNHHNIKDPYFRFMMHTHGGDSVRDNIRSVANFLLDIQRDTTETVVVESNHDLAFKRWLKEADYKTDPENAIFFLENQLEMYRALKDGMKDFSVFGHAIYMERPDLQNTTFLSVDQSFRICGEDGKGIECGNHGHIGNNGARGSINAFVVRGHRENVGHSHSAMIKDGVCSAGVLGSLDMEYNQGGSSWSHSNIVTNALGKRQTVTIKNGKWRA
jgi:hypothetical protein